MRLGRGLRLACGLVAVLAVAGCDGDTRDLPLSGPTASGDIVVESATLETEDARDFFPRTCRVHGVIRNDGPADRRVTLDFTAFDSGRATIASAVAGGIRVPAGGRAGYEAIFRNDSDDGFLNDCDRVHRFEVAIDTTAAT